MEIENEMLFQDHSDLEIQDVTKRINEIISGDNSILYKKGNINEWVNLDDRYLITASAKPQYISFVKYVDELYTNLFDKMKLINTLANMIIVASVPIEEVEINSLYVLVDYFKDVKASKYREEYQLLSDPELLLIARYNTLEPNKRVAILKYIVDRAKEEKLDLEDDKKVFTFLTKIKKEISTNPADKLLNN